MDIVVVAGDERCVLHVWFAAQRWMVVVWLNVGSGNVHTHGGIGWLGGGRNGQLIDSVVVA